MAGALLRNIAVAAGLVASLARAASYNGLAITPAMGWVSSLPSPPPKPMYPNPR